MMGNATIPYYLMFIPTIIVAITGHEFAHAWLADKFGDPTAKQQGRVSLNPLVHIDPVGFLGILLVGFGWGRPVPVDAGRLRHPRAELLVSAAGPGMNLLLAALAGALLRLPGVTEGLSQTAGAWAGAAVVMFVHTNVMLACFNFLPFFPLDGSHMVQNLLPGSLAERFRTFNRTYGYVLLMGLILSGYVLRVSPLSLLLGPPIRSITSLLLGS